MVPTGNRLDGLNQDDLVLELETIEVFGVCLDVLFVCLVVGRLNTISVSAED